MNKESEYIKEQEACRARILLVSGTESKTPPAVANPGKYRNAKLSHRLRAREASGFVPGHTTPRTSATARRLSVTIERNVNERKSPFVYRSCTGNALHHFANSQNLSNVQKFLFSTSRKKKRISTLRAFKVDVFWKTKFISNYHNKLFRDITE